MPTTPRESDQRSVAAADLASVESARRTAVERTRRPSWLLIAFALLMGCAFSFALLRTPLGWAVGAALFVVSMVAFVLLDARLMRRRGRLLNLGGPNALRFLLLYGAMFVLGQIQPPAGWQPWFAVGAGLLVAGMVYVNIHWHEAANARRLAEGDFERGDLMP